MSPEEAAQAAQDLRAKYVLPAHAGRFAIANHPWNEPYERISKASENKPYTLLTPKIGEAVELKKENQVFGKWWEEIKD